jgi:arylsulfatase
MSGKWHLAGKKLTVYPNDRGFDEFYGILGGAASFFAPFSLSRNRVNVEKEATNNPDYYFTDAISSEAVRMVQTADPDRPLFLYVAYTAAHWPLHARQADIKAYRGKYAMGWDKMRQQRLVRMKALGILPQGLGLSPRNSKVPPWDATENQAWQQRRMEVYAAQVTAMDRGIGKLVESLEKTGRLENTLLFFTIDNGGCHVEYRQDRKGSYLPAKTRDGRSLRPGNLPSIMPGPEDTYQSYGYGWANASNTPYRMFKQYDHEGGIRTPMIAHWPRGIKNPGTLVQGVSHLIDILPTVMEVTETKVPAELRGKQTIGRDGQSLAAAFRDEASPVERTLFFSHAKGRALRHGKWKLVSRDRKSWELYDLSRDPLELEDLAEQETERRDTLIRQWRDESRRHAEQAKLR